jgi:hypothetical protein
VPGLSLFLILLSLVAVVVRRVLAALVLADIGQTGELLGVGRVLKVI